MGEKKNNAGEKKKKKNDGDGGDKKKEDSPMIVVLKIDMHCDGCASKFRKTVLGFEGVQKAEAETDANKLTVVGKVDPSEVREKLAEKTGKKVDLVSPQPKKDKDEKKDDNKKKADGNDNKNNADDKKPKEKEPPVTTAVFKLRLHCQGCIGKIRRTITKTKGFNDMSIDKQKDLITVIGSMDMKALAESLQEKLKRPVEIVPPKKEKEGGGEKEGGKGGGKKKGGGGGDGGQSDGGGKIVEESRMEYTGQPIPAFGYGLGYPPGYGYGYGYPPGYMGENTHAPHTHAPHMHPPHMHAPLVHSTHMHAPQLFSDENPNACSVM